MSKYLEDLRGKHKGEELWVIGAGPSLDAYPVDFFKDKICVGVNWTFSVFLDIGDGIEKFNARTLYSVHSHGEPANWIAKHIPHFLTNCFFISHPQSYRRYKGRPYCYPEDFNSDPYWIRNSFRIEDVKASDADFKAMAKCIMAKKDDCRYLCRGTTLHWAIEVAVVLGAKKICIAGVGGGTGHIRKRGFLYSTIKPYGNKYSHWREGTRSLAKVFKPYRIEIVNHTYDRGEQPL